MRALPLALVVLLAVPMVDASGWKLMAHRHSEEPGWWAESFTLHNETQWIKITFGDDTAGELAMNIISLYDGADNPLAMYLFVVPGGKVVDVVGNAGGVEARTDELPGLGRNGVFEHTMYLRCDATCNPSRSFKLAVTAAGALDAWGYGLFLQDGALHAATNGTGAVALSSREMGGTTLHATGPYGGATLVQGAVVDATANDMMLAAFLKDGAKPQRMLARTPTGDVPCTCFIDEGPAGDYQFVFDDVDPWGREAWLTYADVRLP